MEEIIDNRPRTIQLKRDVAAENGEQGFRFTEPVANKFKSNFLTVKVIENEQSVEQIKINLSEMLWPQQGKTFIWHFDRMKTLAIHFLEIKITT